MRGVKDVLQGADERRRVVQALSSSDFKAECAAHLAEVDVNVVQDLDVISEEADGLHDHGCVAGFR